MTNDFLKQYFDRNNINQCVIAKETGIARSKINLILNGKRKLTADELIKIAIAFNINLEQIKKEIKNATKHNDF